ncbi:MAG: tetratricopeptide repeat protein [Spirochaetia bacterium]|nr:tetratricopeptide repeat protein [Spirochaetia bacterium]
MSQQQVRTEDKNFKTVLTTFLSNNWRTLIVIAVIIVVLVIGGGVYTLVHQNRVEKSAVAAEQVQTLYADLQAAEGGEKDEIAEELVSAAEEAIGNFSGMYAAARSHLVLGRMAYDQKNFEKALEHFNALADSQPKNYLAPISLMHAATAHEEAEEYEDAIAAYQRVRENYSDTFPEVPHALFSIGRLYEKIDNKDAALQAYNEVIDDFSSSNWTNFST